MWQRLLRHGPMNKYSFIGDPCRSFIADLSTSVSPATPNRSAAGGYVTHTHTHTNTHARIYENDTHIKMCPDTEFLQTFLVIDSICSKCQLIAVWMECWMNGLWNEFRNKLKTDGAKAKVHGQCGVCVCGRLFKLVNGSHLFRPMSLSQRSSDVRF